MNRRNLLKLTSLSPFAALPAFGVEKENATKVSLFPFQEEMMEDIKKFRHNIFILPRGGGKTWMTRYVTMDEWVEFPNSYFEERRRHLAINHLTNYQKTFIIDEIKDKDDFRFINEKISDKNKTISLLTENEYNKDIILSTIAARKYDRKWGERNVNIKEINCFVKRDENIERRAEFFYCQ